MPYTSTTVAFRGFVAQAIAKAYAQRDPGKDVSGTFPCPRCRSTLNFTTLMNGLSRGTCVSGGCVRWTQ